ncbi:MAG: hypothetical protein JJU19_09400 [Pararhodobacter sp.]|nr:hypothetical protein [Pararhodobacter sp.]
MTLGQAFARTWRRALIFGVVFLFIAIGLDAMIGRDIAWATRLITVGVAVVVYWLLSAWSLQRQQA